MQALLCIASQLMPAPQYEIFHDALGSPILDWRAQFQRQQRLFAIGLPIAALSLMIGCIFYYFGSSISGPNDSTGEIAVLMICCSMVGISAALGFLAGWGMSRGR